MDTIKDKDWACFIALDSARNKYRDNKFICENKAICKRYFDGRNIVSQNEITRVYNVLYHKMVASVNEINNLAEKNCLHRSQLHGLLKDIEEAYIEYDDFSITEFTIDYDRCLYCKEINVNPSKILKNVCCKCEKDIYSKIIINDGIEKFNDILDVLDISADDDISTITDKVLTDKKISRAIIERHNKIVESK